MKLDLSRHVFGKKKSKNIKFYQNLSSGYQAVPLGWTDRQDEANSRFSQFCERPH